MDYLKFNCYDLAAQNTELHDVYSKMQPLCDELTDTLSALDPQIKSYEDINNQLSAAQTSVVDIGARILSAHNALDQVIDLYYAAENKALQSAEELPVSLSRTNNGRNVSTAQNYKISPSTINSGDLVLEDWLAELVYRYGKDEDKG